MTYVSRTKLLLVTLSLRSSVVESSTYCTDAWCVLGLQLAQFSTEPLSFGACRGDFAGQSQTTLV
jgi:hypothetical protein